MLVVDLASTVLVILVSSVLVQAVALTRERRPIEYYNVSTRRLMLLTIQRSIDRLLQRVGCVKPAYKVPFQRLAFRRRQERKKMVMLAHKNSTSTSTTAVVHDNNNNNKEKKSTSPSSLPPEVWRIILRYLEPTDAINVCQILQQSQCNNFTLSWLCPPRSYQQMASFLGDDETGDIPKIAIPLPTYFDVTNYRLHSLKLEMMWKDQGWGNQKGGLWVVESDTCENNAACCKDLYHADNKIVYESPIAPKKQEKLSIEWTPKADKTYKLWVRVGGGGGHALHLSFIRLHKLVYDHVDRPLLKAYMAMHHHDLIGSDNTILPHKRQEAMELMALVKSLLRSDEMKSNDDNSSSSGSTSSADKRYELAAAHQSLRDRGFQTDEASLEAIEEVLEAMFLYGRCKLVI